MKQIDVRFSEEELNLIKDMIGTALTKYKCNTFTSPDAYGIIDICTDKSSYAFTNFIHVMDYYGTKEDVAVFRVEKRPESKINSLISNNTMIEIPVNKAIKEIDIVNEHQKVFRNNIQTYDVWLTRGIIFKLDDEVEISLEKNIWFSEMITIDKGEQLLNKFTPVKEFIENWEGDYRGECTREIIKIS